MFDTSIGHDPLQSDEKIIAFTIIDVTEALVTLDANHQLAEKDIPHIWRFPAACCGTLPKANYFP